MWLIKYGFFYQFFLQLEATNHPPILAQVVLVFLGPQRGGGVPHGGAKNGPIGAFLEKFSIGAVALMEIVF